MPTPARSTKPTVEPFALSKRAMLVSLELSRWNGRMADSESTAELLEEKKAESDAAQVRKVLVPRSDMRGVTEAFNEARSTFRWRTLPWDRGVGIIRSDAFLGFQEEMQKLITKCGKAADEFARKTYPECLKRAPQRLGELYDAADFPEVGSIRERFGAKLVVLPIPSAEDFRIDLASEALAHIRKETEAHLVEKISDAQKEVWVRLRDVLSHFVEVMKNDGAKFRDSTVHNLAATAVEVQALALSPDPQLTTICTELRKMAAANTPDTLREDSKTRAAVAKTAAETMARIERIMKGAF